MAFEIIARVAGILDTEAEIIFVPLFQAESKTEEKSGVKESAKKTSGESRQAPLPGSDVLPKQLQAAVQNAVNTKRFEGKKKQAFALYLSEKSTIVLVGLGKKKDYSSAALRQAGVIVSRVSRDRKSKKSAFLLPQYAVVRNMAYSAQALSESLLLSLYKFDQLKTKDKNNDGPESCEFLLSQQKEVSIAQQAVSSAKVIVEAINKARDLINLPPNIATPSYVAEAARKMAKECGLRCTVLGKKELSQEKMNLLLAVSQGSAEEPQFVILEHAGSAKGSVKDPICLVGKGITYDSGGLNLKPYMGSAATMRNMKTDMAGAATVLAVAEISARLKLPQRMIAVMPLCENMPDARSYKCDDIITSYSGLSVEITNTDAEGRLVLADALAYAEKKYSPQCLIDVATLTGAASVALGYLGACLLSTDQKLADGISLAAVDTDERLWQFPLWEEYGELLDSPIADLKNSNESSGPGTIMGGIFLKNFVKDTPWAHLDIASVAATEKGLHYTTNGATGFGIRLLAEFVRRAK
ncbi:MAG TPA: leucyl aminopeptidase [Candidatus Nanoarchaeia archaeon]|nr:leucyl aminopeptidase [Candidatus Nanoarchaeia archaeon]